MTLASRELAGTWLLERWQVHYHGGRPPDEPFGPDPSGILIYAPDGWMSATMSVRRRSPLSHLSARRADAASKARALDEYLAYAGRWRLEGDIVVHDVELSVNPVLIGTRQLRRAVLSGVALQLEAQETADGAARVHRIEWRRAPAG
jgi:hypothetical protein